MESRMLAKKPLVYVRLGAFSFEGGERKRREVLG